MVSLLALPEVSTAVSHQCEYGLYSMSRDGVMRLSKKPTKLASNAQPMLDRLQRRCSVTHEHQVLDGGKTRAAEIYHPALVLEILRGMRDTADRDPGIMPADSADVAMETSGDNVSNLSVKNSSFNSVEFDKTWAFEFKDRDVAAATQSTKSEFTMASGKKIPIAWDFKSTYKDEDTSEELPETQIRAAIADELQCFNSHVWEGVPLEEAKRDHGAKILNSRWVTSNKGDLASRDCRARFVACEVNTCAEEDANFFAATPPLEAKRLLLSEWATKRQRNGNVLQLHFSDAKKAYFNGVPTRRLYIRLPKEMCLGPNVVGRLLRCCYGTRDAGAIWEQYYADSLISIGFQQGRASPCCFWHPLWEISLVIHGDDLTALGTPESLDVYEAALQKCLRSRFVGALESMTTT